MTHKEEAARVRGTGGKEKNATDSLRSHPHYTPNMRRVQGPAHGRVVGTVWRKSASRSALLGFYAELERIAQERWQRDDQVTLAIRPDLKRGGLPKAQGNGDGGDATCKRSK